MSPQWFETRFIESAKKERRECVSCSRSMWFPPSVADRYKTCGGECATARYSAMKAVRERACETCAQRFIPRTQQKGKGERRFCSMACALPHIQSIGHTPEANAKRAAKMAGLREQGQIKYLAGPESPSWKGGKEVALRRRVDSGKAAESVRQYRERNPEKLREFAQRRKGRKLGRLPKGTIPTLLKLQRGCCPICKAKLAGKYHVDHVMPLAKGGLHERSNVQLLCPPCNVRKSAKDPVQYMQERGFLL